MKTKFFGIIIIAIIVIIATWNTVQNNRVIAFSDLALSNIEALANNEDGYDVICGQYSGACWWPMGICFDGEYTREKCEFIGYTWSYCKDC